MAEPKTPEGAPEAVEGLAGGPGPTPPGFDDGTPQAAAEGTGAPLPAQGAADEDAAAEPPRDAATGPERREAPRGDPEEPDPS